MKDRESGYLMPLEIMMMIRRPEPSIQVIEVIESHEQRCRDLHQHKQDCRVNLSLSDVSSSTALCKEISHSET